MEVIDKEEFLDLVNKLHVLDTIRKNSYDSILKILLPFIDNLVEISNIYNPVSNNYDILKDIPHNDNLLWDILIDIDKDGTQFFVCNYVVSNNHNYYGSLRFPVKFITDSEIFDNWLCGLKEKYYEWNITVNNSEKNNRRKLYDVLKKEFESKG